MTHSAFKHAFINQKNCRITIELLKDSNGVVSIFIQDNGKGISDLKKSNGTQGMGSLLIEALTDQIDGEFKISKNYGTHISLTFQS